MWGEEEAAAAASTVLSMRSLPPLGWEGVRPSTAAMGAIDSMRACHSREDSAGSSATPASSTASSGVAPLRSGGGTSWSHQGSSRLMMSGSAEAAEAEVSDEYGVPPAVVVRCGGGGR